jgi:hypothetical protein
VPANQPRKHHYLPQFYLKGFAEVDGRLQQCERLIGKVVTTGVGDAASRKDFHRFEDTVSSFDPFAAEKIFAKLEGIQAQALKKTLGNPDLLDTDLDLRAEMIGFLQMMFFRVPKVHEMLANTTSKAVEAGIKVMEKNGGFMDMPEELKRQLAGRSVSDVLRPKPKNWFLILSMLRHGNSRELYKLLWPRNVAVMVAKGFRSFIAGDAAVAIYDRRHGQTAWKASGFASTTAEFSFPLSARMMMVVGHEVPPGVLNVSDDEVRQFNRRTIVWSQRFLFSETFDAVTLRDIMELADRKAGFSAENFDAADGIYTISRMDPLHPGLLDLHWAQPHL